MTQAPNLLHAMCKAGETFHGLGYLGNTQAERARRSIGHAGILPIVRALQGGHGTQINPGHFLAILPVTENAINRRYAFFYFVNHRHRAHDSTIFDTHGNFSAPFIINADQGCISFVLLQEHPGFDSRVALHGAVAIQMIRRQVDQYTDIRFQAGHEINLTPDHLDRHGTMENYAAIKARMFLKQDADDTALIGVDDEWCAEIAMGIKGGPTLRAVSVVHEIEEGVSAVDGILRDWQNGKEVARIDLRAMPALKGAHNWQNACMAYGAARTLGLSVAEITKAMESFPGLAHRMQEVGCLGHVPFINDSKATNADAAAKALASFEDIFWITGGIAKAGGIEPLAPFFPRIEKAYLIGEAADAFAKTLCGKVPFELCGTLDKAIFASARDAVNSRRENAVVLLSPACASFDHYRNFEIRGDAFVKLVSELPGIAMTIEGVS